MSTESLNPDDVVSVESNVPVINRSTVQVHEVLDSILQKLGSNSQFFSEGIEGQVLRSGGHWRKGKVRVNLEFIPDDNQ